MQNYSKNTVAIFAIVVGIILGGLVGYTLAPVQTEVEVQTETVEKLPLEGTTIKIGTLAATSDRIETVFPLVSEIIQPGINEYVANLGYDVTFEFPLDNNEGQGAICLEKIQAFNTMGISHVANAGYSGHQQAALSYVNENNIIMVSPSSSSPLLSIPDDNLFRLGPNDFSQGRAIPQLHASWGAEAVIILQRADSWGDGIYNMLVSEFPNQGIEILERYRYAPEVREFSNYLHSMNEKVGEAIDQYGVDKVHIQCMFQDEMVVIISQSTDYPNLQKVRWFGTENSGRNTRVIDDAGEDAVHLKIFGPLMGPSLTDKWRNFEESYVNIVGLYPDFYAGNLYDTAYLLAMSIIDTQSLDASDSVRYFPKLADNYFGVTGWCTLDETGDRKPGLYDIWGYATIDGEPSFTKYGEWDGRTDTVSWDLALLEQQGVILPEYLQAKWVSP